MEPIITIDTGADVVTFTGTNVAGGYIYDNDTMDAWLKLAEVNAKFNKRPNAHGTYTPDQLFTNEARIPFSGRFFGASAGDAVLARNRLAALFNDGKPVTVSVVDDLGVTSRRCFVVSIEPEWMPDAYFDFAFELAAPDPRRYGPVQSIPTGLPTAGSGLVWPLGSGSSFWDWGSAGTSGRAVFTNRGNTTTYPVMLVGGGGNLAAGFQVTEVQTGRTVTYPVATAGAVVMLNSRTQRASINGGDVTRNLTRREWFAVPRGASYEYQFVTLGATTGSPTLELLAADAYL